MEVEVQVQVQVTALVQGLARVLCNRYLRCNSSRNLACTSHLFLQKGIWRNHFHLVSSMHSNSKQLEVKVPAKVLEV